MCKELCWISHGYIYCYHGQFDIWRILYLISINIFEYMKTEGHALWIYLCTKNPSKGCLSFRVQTFGSCGKPQKYIPPSIVHADNANTLSLKLVKNDFIRYLHRTHFDQNLTIFSNTFAGYPVLFVRSPLFPCCMVLFSVKRTFELLLICFMDHILSVCWLGYVNVKIKIIISVR